MQASLEQYIRDRIGADDAQLGEVLSHFVPLKTRRNQLLVREGDVCRYCYFIIKGCVQVFVYDRNGDESTRDIVVENNWVSELYSFGNQAPARENIRVVEPGQLMAIGFDSFQKMVQTVPPFEQIYRQIVEQSYVNSVFRLNTFVAMDALERMQWIKEYQPKLLARLSSKLVASYLGISPETYSRLKARL
ncbi:putative transcriptional regulator, Crp/Fnr family [Fibrisoma limi BUZ 3]|uniref:Putative transcriptional regulator, Crp/Fnr family n=1 Tax=Fibrisoma limi BUZ 3 TaxID=1185876 RepID=I2GJ07_9BACT|nr:Crp/Fnr family transcriptional regulator [Fibrisoma limi]CCH53882.1 putative transcriptional regulator, Crp/Fnr family [Fibrisoma limi BUZ 3]